MRRAGAVLAALLLGACATSVRRSMPPAAGDWLTTLAAAKGQAAQGHYDEADRALYDFSQRFAGAPEAREATYWRAIFKLDPANRAASPRAGLEQLDAYLADSTDALHLTEARTLRRIASALDSLSQQHQVAQNADDAARIEEAARADQRADSLQKETDRLRDQLDKTKAELERIKKRLQEKNPE